MVKAKANRRTRKQARKTSHTIPDANTAAPHIAVYAVEERTQITPGAPPMTIRREVELRNGIGRKSVRVTRGNRILSDVTRKLNLTERKHIRRRKYIKGLYKPLERETLRSLN